MENEAEKLFVEVKGVTLERDGVAYFPDAPTQRGRKHIDELIKAKSEGYCAAILFVIQMKGCRFFMPNDETDHEFSEKLRQAAYSGVEILAVDCIVTEDSLTIDERIEVQL